jgi:hypothetical protein
MKTANEEYKSALGEAGQSRPVPLNIGRIAKQRIPGSGLNDTSHHSGSGKGGQGVIGSDVSRLVFQQYHPLRLGRAALSWIEQPWSTQSIDCIEIAARWTATRRERMERRTDYRFTGSVALNHIVQGYRPSDWEQPRQYPTARTIASTYQRLYAHRHELLAIYETRYPLT